MSQFLDRHAADVSRGGIFVRNAQVLPVGRTVRLNLQLANGSTLLAGEGTVFWTREADPTRAESEPGMGIRFTRLTAESQQMLTHLLSEKSERERQDDGASFDEDERTVVATEEEMRAANESHDEPVISIGTLALAKVVALPPPPVRAAPTLPAVARPLAAVAARPLAMLEPAAPRPAPVRAAPLRAATVAIAPTIAAPAPIRIAPAATQVAHAPVHAAPAATPAAFAPTVPALLPVPEAASAAWEDDDDSFGSVALSPPSDADEHTDLVPRGRHGVGIAVAIGAIAALAACLMLLHKPAAKRLLPAPAAITAPLAAAAPAAPAPFPVPAVIIETAASTTRPLAPPAP